MIKFNGMEMGGYEYLWWVEYAGAHLPGGTLPGMYSARGAGEHYILIVPSLDLVIVHRFDNEPASEDTQSVIDAAQRPGVDATKSATW